MKERLDKLVEEGWLISQVHPTLDLTIYNYSQKTQYEGHWTPETLAARGLVLNSKGEVVARPFPKFFNAEEVKDEIPDLPFEVYEKMDGSLGIFFWYADENTESMVPVFASRGSFTSEQAVKGWEMLKKRPYHDLHWGYTHIFEVIYPENRIVVDYGGMEDLVLLGIIKTSDGTEVSRQNIEEHLSDSFNLVNVYNFKESWITLKSRNEPNSEGYVLRFSNGYRVKVKFEDYVRLHRIVTQVSNVDVWEMLKEGKPLDELIDRVPDEFYDWVKETVRDLVTRHDNILSDYQSYYRDICEKVSPDDRKAFAEEAKRYNHPGILFGMLDGKDCSQIVWKMIRPKWSKPFKKEELS